MNMPIKVKKRTRRQIEINKGKCFFKDESLKYQNLDEILTFNLLLQT